MKKLLVLITFIFISTNAHAEFIGGILKTHKGQKMALKCVETSETGNCVSMDVMIKWEYTEEFERMLNFDVEEMDREELRRHASEYANEDINENYATAAYAGTVTGFAVAYYSQSGIIGVPAMVLGAAIDIVKAPVVGVLYLTHKGSDLLMKKKMMKGLKFMLNPEKKGKEKRLRKRYFSALRQSFYEI